MLIFLVTVITVSTFWTSWHTLIWLELTPLPSIQFTYIRDDYSASSWPDHILTLSHNASQIVGVACLDDVDNFSDHLPLVFNLVLQVPLAMLSSPRDTGSHSCPNTADRIDWHMVTSQQVHDFCCYLDMNLPTVPDDLVNCCDPNCKSHCQLLDLLCSQISWVHTYWV